MLFLLRKKYAISLLLFAVFYLSACHTTARQADVSSLPHVDAETSATVDADDPRSQTAEQQIIARLGVELRMPVAMVVEQLYDNDGWLFYVGHPVNPDGSRINISQTPFKKDQDEGYFDDVFMALLHRNTSDSKVDLVNFSYGATDAPFVGWAEQHGLPLCYFSDNAECE